MGFTAKEPRPEKIEAVKKLRETVAGASFVILVDYHGLDVKTLSGIRNKFQESGSDFHVVKNTVFQRAVVDTPAAPLAEQLRGSSAVAYASDDVVSTAKTVLEHTKGPKPLVIKSAVLDGELLDKDQIEALSKVPSRQELYAMVVGGIQAPITGLVGTLQTLYGQFVMTLQAISEQKSEQA